VFELGSASLPTVRAIFLGHRIFSSKWFRISKGYAAWAEAMEPVIAELMAE